MKLAFVYDMAYPFNIGGVEVRNYEIINILRKKHEIHFFCVKMWDGPDILLKDGVTYHGVCRYGRSNTFKGQRALHGPVKFALAFLWPLLRERCDLISIDAVPYFQCFTGRLAGFLGRRPVVFIWHGFITHYWLEHLGKIKGTVGALLEKISLHLTRHHIAVSQTVKNLMMSAGGKEKNISISYNGVDLDLVHSVQSKNKDGRPIDVLFVGRFTHQKNIQLLLRSIVELKKRLPECKAVLIGDGPDMSMVKKYIREQRLESNISIVGWKTPEETFSYMCRAKILSVPSHWEGFGIVALEANACGTPVVTVEGELNAVCELLDSNNGLVVPGNPESLAEAYYALLNDGNKWNTMSQNAIQKSLTFSWKSITQDLESLYTSFL